MDQRIAIGRSCLCFCPGERTGFESAGPLIQNCNNVQTIRCTHHRFAVLQKPTEPGLKPIKAQEDDILAKLQFQRLQRLQRGLISGDFLIYQFSSWLISSAFLPC